MLVRTDTFVMDENDCGRVFVVTQGGACGFPVIGTAAQFREMSAAFARIADRITENVDAARMADLFAEAQEQPHLPERIEACETVAAMDDAGAMLEGDRWE